jgi:hypothetical protein
MIAHCPNCKAERHVILCYTAEKLFNTETKEVEYIDIEFTHAHCPDCLYPFDALKYGTAQGQLSADEISKGYYAT